MPPKCKKRKTKETEDEILYQEQLQISFFKHRYDEDENEDGNDFMFEEENPKILLNSLKEISVDLGLKWDPAVLSILDPEQQEKKTIDLERTKLIFDILKTVEKQQDDMIYLFKTFSDPKTDLITQESLSVALKHLNIRESNEKMALLIAFAHEQPFLKLILSEQTSGKALSSFTNLSGVNFEEFRRTFIRCTFLANS